MDMMAVRRRVLMGQKIPEQWDYVFVKEKQFVTWMLDVTEGQSITIQWETPADVTQNQNAWVLNGNGCCPNISQVRYVGENGEQTLTITQSGQIRVGGYAGYETFNLQVGTIVRVRFN